MWVEPHDGISALAKGAPESLLSPLLSGLEKQVCLNWGRCLGAPIILEFWSLPSKTFGVGKKAPRPLRPEEGWVKASTLSALCGVSGAYFEVSAHPLKTLLS